MSSFNWQRDIMERIKQIPEDKLGDVLFKIIEQLEITEDMKIEMIRNSINKIKYN